MAERRMFAKSIISSARFLRMPAASRLLYYDLGMDADDDGVVEAYTVMRKTGANDDDLQILVSKGFVRVLNDDLVSLILDWKTYVNALVDKMSMYVNQLDAARARLQQLVERQNAEHEIIKQAVDRLHTVQQRDIIRYRYLMGLNWHDVNQHMYGHLDDFEYREESYLRRATKAHGVAIRQLDTILDDLLSPVSVESASPVNAADG